MAVSKESPALRGAVPVSPRPRSRPSPRLRMPRVFTQPGVHPFDAVAWEKRSARITNEKGEVVFEQHDVEVPAFWSQMATNVVVSKYFHGPTASRARSRAGRARIVTSRPKATLQRSRPS
jgi:hypothetical protein